MNFKKRLFSWDDGKTLELGDEPSIMGILNITPDSFSDGGKWNSIEAAVKHGKEMVLQGANIIDVGAESTRPGHTVLTYEEEIERLKKILPSLITELTVPISVDTYHWQTAKYVIEAGAHIVNDIWGLQYDNGEMADVVADKNVPVIIMHNQKDDIYNGDIIDCLKSFFDKSLEIAAKHKIDEEQIILDPGIGFNKNSEENLEILKRLDELTCEYKYPWLLGVSRKRFIGTVLDLPVNERDEGTGAVSIWGITKKCTIMRVHNVALNARLIKMWNALSTKV